MPIRPGPFGQRAPGTAVPGFGNAALSTCRAAGVLRGNQPDEGRQLPRRVETGEVSQFGDDGNGDQPLHAAERLQRLHDGIQSPRRPDLLQFGLEPPEPVDLFIDRAQRFLKDDLLRGRGTDDLREVPAMGGVPVGPADVVQPEAEQEGLQAQLRVLEREPRRIACATQVAEGLSSTVGT